MNETTYAEEHEQSSGLGWPVIRLSLHGGAAVLAVLAFAFLVLQLRGEAQTPTSAWVLMSLLLAILAGQVALMVFGRDRVVVAEAGEAEETTWAAPETTETSWAAPEEASAAEASWAVPEATWEQEAPETVETPVEETPDPVDEMVTIGCPACEGTFHMSESDIAGGQFHCPKCGVAGFLGE